MEFLRHNKSQAKKAIVMLVRLDAEETAKTSERFDSWVSNEGSDCMLAGSATILTVIKQLLLRIVWPRIAQLLKNAS